MTDREALQMAVNELARMQGCGGEDDYESIGDLLNEIEQGTGVRPE